MKKTFKYILMMIITVTVASQAHATEIILKDAVSVTSDAVMLSDVVSAGAVNAGALDAFATYVLCKAPRAGYKREVNKAYVIMKMKQAKIFSPDMTFAGAKYVVITREDVCVSVAEQQASLKAWIAQQLDVRMGDFTVEYRTKLEDVFLSKGEVELSFNGDVATFMRRNVGVFVEYCVNGSVERRQAVSFNLRFKKTILVSRRRISRGDDVTPADVSSVEAYVGMFDGEYSILESVSNVVAKRNISLNAPIMCNDVEPKVVVNRGDMVACSIADKNMMMKVSLQACEDGVVGETIKFLNVTTKKPLMGTVLSNGYAELAL